MSKSINPENIRILGDGVDPTGHVFEYEGTVYRSISESNVPRMKKIIDSGLFESLEKLNLIVKTSISKMSYSGSSLLLESEKIDPVVYPYEWTFSSLRDAALTILKIQSIASEFGYQLIDTHPFNLVLHNGQIKCIDIGSFEEKNEGGWKGYADFKESFYYPLKIWSAGNSNLARGVLFIGPRRVPTYQYLLYQYPILRSIRSPFIHKLLQYYSYFETIYTIPEHKIRAYPNKFLSKIATTLLRKKLLPKMNSDQSVNNLKNKILSLRRPASKTEWDSYYTLMQDHTDDLARFDRVIEIIKKFEASRLVDLAGNDGYFCKMALEKTKIKSAVNIDGDEDAIDRLYNAVLADKSLRITPVMNNIMQPNGSLHERPPHIRFKSDLVTSFGVTHHLLLGQGFTIAEVLSTIRNYSNKYVLIEFMPKGVYSDIENYQSVLPHWYTVDWFRDNFKKYFHLIGEEQLNSSRIIFWGEVKQ